MQHNDCLQKDESPFFRKPVKLTRLLRIDHGGLFADHVFAVFKEKPALFIMQGIGTCDVNSVNIAFAIVFKSSNAKSQLFCAANSLACVMSRE